MQPGDEQPSIEAAADPPAAHWSQRVDWAGLSVFVLAAAVGVAVVVIVAAEVITPAQEVASVLVTALTTILGAMIGAVSTYVGLYRRTGPARHRRKEES